MIKTTNDKGVSVIFILLFIAIVLGGVGYFVYKNSIPLNIATDTNTNQDQTLLNSPTPVPTPKPTPITLHPDEGTKGNFQIGMGTHEGPTMTSLVIDPLDVKKGQTLTVLLKAFSTSPITSIVATLEEDSQNQTFNLKLTDGTATNGTWTGSVLLSDSVDYKYLLTFKAKSSDGKSSSVTAGLRN